MENSIWSFNLPIHPSSLFIQLNKQNIYGKTIRLENTVLVGKSQDKFVLNKYLISKKKNVNLQSEIYFFQATLHSVLTFSVLVKTFDLQREKESGIFFSCF